MILIYNINYKLLMNYYILPKNNINFKINFKFTKTNQLQSFISKSVLYFLNNIKTNLLNIEKDQDQNKDELIDYNMNLVTTIINTYEFIFSPVPGSWLSVSKVKPDSNIFFELLEIYHVCNIKELFIKKEMLNVHISPNYNSSIYCLNIVRDKENDINMSEEFDFYKVYQKFILNKSSLKIDFLYFEFKKEDYINISKYIFNMILILYIVIKYQNNDGVTIIKMDNILYKGIIDIIYLFSCIFDKLHIIKPLVSNILSSDRFLVCKKFINNNNIQNILNKLEDLIHSYIKHKMDEHFVLESIIDNEIPYLLINKIEESNIVVAQQQLESLDQVINIIKNKNKDDKMEILKRNHIQKCIQWCEKYKIPHNKFIDKLNIFLNTNNNLSSSNYKNLIKSINENENDNLDCNNKIIIINELKEEEEYVLESETETEIEY